LPAGRASDRRRRPQRQRDRRRPGSGVDGARVLCARGFGRWRLHADRLVGCRRNRHWHRGRHRLRGLRSAVEGGLP
jgi:hypothetical protein